MATALKTGTVGIRQMKKAFTLVELLVVIAIIAILLGLLMPGLGRARAKTRSVLCQNNLRLLSIANNGYAAEHQDRYVIAAADIAGDNFQRWHGVRTSLDEPFDPYRSPLVKYISGGKVKQCPQYVEFRHNDPWDWDFEDGCGGYGYNMTYLGSYLWSGKSFSEACQSSIKSAQVKYPSETLMFADTAMAKLDKGVPYYLEYSFAEPPYFIGPDGEPITTWFASPSIHFRHLDRANVVWVDGHVDSQTMLPSDRVNAYGVTSSDMMLGWFGSLTNRLFDLE